MRAYIGFEGLGCRTEANALLASLPARAVRMLMIGVNGNARTLEGRGSHRPPRTPKTEDIADVFSDDPRALNLIAYATDQPATLGEQLIRMAAYGGPHFHGFQLKMCWPDPREIERFSARRPHDRIVLRVGPRALSEVSSHPDRLAARLEEYAGVITDVLLDPTGGHERLFHAARVVDQLGAILDTNRNIGLGLVARLEDHAIDRLKPIFAEIPTLSLMAEDRLDAPKPALDLEAAQAFYASAHARFREVL